MIVRTGPIRKRTKSSGGMDLSGERHSSVADSFEHKENSKLIKFGESINT
jgi:hypothetical protein